MLSIANGTAVGLVARALCYLNPFLGEGLISSRE